MKQGKLTNRQLEECVLSRISPQNAETVVGAGIGEDCCAINTGGICVVSTDPITASNAQAGVLAIHINANDIASSGAVPVAALVTILIPPSARQEQVDTVVAQLAQTAASLKIDITGGHTEVTDSVNRIVVSVTMIGKPVLAGRVFRTADMRPGDEIVMTKSAGMEGAAILAEDYAEELAPILSKEDYTQVEQIKEALSVVREGVAAAALPGVSAMHDITEGGVIGALIEMAEASHTGVEVDLSRVPVLPVTEKICGYYGIDVYYLISSGSMLISAKDGGLVAQELRKIGISARVIGSVRQGSGVTEVCSGQKLAARQADELYKVLEKPR